MVSLISINSSSKSSTSSATPVANVIKAWGNSTISSCVLGISKIGRASIISNNIAHAALLLLKEQISIEEEESDILNRTGILIEYGDYSPDMCPTEKDYADKGLVIYHYDKKGGLRYYAKEYDKFSETFGDRGYIDLNIDSYNQMTFDYFINKIAKKENCKWIKEKYSVGFYNFNCQNFVIEALKELKPHFGLGDVYPKDSTLAAKKSKQKLDFIPSNIKTEIMGYYRK